MTDTEKITLKDITKQKMLQEAEMAGKAEWFLDICKRHYKKKTIKGKQYDDVDLTAVRKEFCKEFYPEMLKPAKPQKLTYLEQVRQAAEIAKEKREKKEARAARKAAKAAKKEN